MTDNYNNESENWKFLPQNGRENPFVVPARYFELLSDRIIAKIEIKEELESFSELSRINKKISFEVPENYFNSLENKLEYKFEMSAFQELAKVKAKLKTKEQPDYFEALDQKLVNKIEVADELKEFSFLKTIKKENNFALDPEYFEDVADRVKERRFAEINKVSWVERLVKFIFKPQIAIAYSIVFIIGLSLTWYFYDSGKITKPGDCKTLACLEKNELLNEQNMGEFDEEHLYDEVDVELLDKQISGSSDSDDATKNVDTSKETTNEINDGI